MYYDDELPGGFQDADFEMRDLEAAGNRSAELARKGVCTHGWLKAPEGKPAVCNHCGKEFESAEAAYREGKRLIGL